MLLAGVTDVSAGMVLMSFVNKVIIVLDCRTKRTTCIFLQSKTMNNLYS